MFMKLLRLSPQAWLTLLEITCIALAVNIGLRVAPLKRLVLRRLTASGPRFRAAAPDPSRLAQMSRLSRAVFRRFPLPLSCLDQSLALWMLLRRHHVPAELKLGLAKAGPSLRAHAWLEHEGIRLLDQADQPEFKRVVLSVTPGSS